MLCLSADCNKVLWTTPGELSRRASVEARPARAQGGRRRSRTAAPATRGGPPRRSGSSWSVHSSNGKQILQADDRLRLQGEHGEAAATRSPSPRRSWRPRTATSSSSRSARRAALARALAARKGGRGGVEDKIVWLMAEPPEGGPLHVPGARGRTPATVRVTETYAFTPKLSNADKAKFLAQEGTGRRQGRRDDGEGHLEAERDAAREARHRDSRPRSARTSSPCSPSR